MPIDDPTDANANPEEFLPYSSTELSEQLINYAQKRLNETEETRRKGLKEIKKFIARDLKVFSGIDDIMLLCFLRSRKFDIKQTCTLMKATADFFESNRSMLEKIDAETVHRVIASKTIGFLPYRDAKGRAILFVRAEGWNPAEVNAEEIIFGTIVSLHEAGENPVNQVAGYTVIFDFKNVSFWQFRALSSWFLFSLQSAQNCCPISVKQIHILHTPALVLLGWKMMSSFLKEDTKNIITFYSSSNWENLHQKMPPCILPEEIGGQLGPYSYEHWASDIPQIQKKFFNTFHGLLNRPKTSNL